MKNIKFPETTPPNPIAITISISNSVVELTTSDLCQLLHEWAGDLNSQGRWHQLHTLARESQSLDFLRQQLQVRWKKSQRPDQEHQLLGRKRMMVCKESFHCIA